MTSNAIGNRSNSSVGNWAWDVGGVGQFSIEISCAKTTKHVLTSEVLVIVKYLGYEMGDCGVHKP